MDSPFYDKEIIIENEHAFAIYDGFPVSKGHTLVVPIGDPPLLFVTYFLT